VILIKPQFEVGREHVGKGGIVSDLKAISLATNSIISFMSEQNFVHRLSVASPISGGDGNKEIVALFRRLG
jgi:23S rRNA (cytidine1920-2'-O)/16S rRNA (cytidine1409-2'-O)-methyltransferase